MKTRRVRVFSAKSAGVVQLGTLVLLSLLMFGVALAQDADPPGRVARLSYLQGSVSLEPAGAPDWTVAELNRPLTTNDKLWSDSPGSRAELDIGGAVIRLSSGTGFSFLNLDDNIAQMQLTSGTVVVHVRELFDNQTYEIDTPNLAVLLDQPGQYRVDVNETGDTTVVRVSEGQAEATDGGQTYPIANQEMVTFTGTDQVSAFGSSLGAPDGFDSWSYERDREFEQAPSRRYVADDMPGTQDLDDNGQWQDTPDYGPVWVPTAVAVGWAPYSYGHWAWVAPWGWTWVDNAAWGFAPFHYGRWARWHNSWCWVPGPRHVRAVYAPAMVAWVGGGGGPGVGWFPLGPREVYVPGYRVSDRYVRSINITNTTIVDHAYITNVYQNRAGNVRYANSGIPGAVTTVSRNVFTSSQPVHGNRMRGPEGGEGGRFAVSARPPTIAPIRQSYIGGAPAGSVRRPPQVLLNRPVVARTPPPGAVSGSRVRLVGPSTQQARGPAANRPGFNGSGTAVPPSRTPMQPSQQQQQQRQEQEQRQQQAQQQRQQQDQARGAGEQSRPGAQQSRQIQPFQPSRNSTPPSQPSAQQQRSNPPMPTPPAEGDTRSWAERAHALDHPTLPPSPRRDDRPASRPEQPAAQQNAEPSRPGPGAAAREDRSNFNSQPNRDEQSRAPANNYSRQPVERSQVEQPQVQRPPVEQPQMQRPPIERPPVQNRFTEERRVAPAAPAQPQPQPQPNRFVAPPPPPAPVPTPPPARIPPAAPPPQQPQQRTPPARTEDRSPPPRVQGRGGDPR